MQRSREQMISDITSLVGQGKDLGQAITENIRKPIMAKPQYQAWSNAKLGITQDTGQWLKMGEDENGNITYRNTATQTYV
jgi:hypothetical protein